MALITSADIYKYFSKISKKLLKTGDYSSKQNSNESNDSSTVSSLQQSDSLLLKSLQNRFNYASADCSARVIVSHPAIRSAPSILQKGKDFYMRYRCSETLGVFVILELCEEIRLDAVIFGNYEMFAGTAGRIRVSGSKKLITTPDDLNWTMLQDCSMRSESETETDKKNNRFKDRAFPLTRANFYKFVKIEFFDQVGDDEFYCSLSQVKFYGQSMLEEYKEKEREVSNNKAKAVVLSTKTYLEKDTESKAWPQPPSNSFTLTHLHSNSQSQSNDKKLNEIFKEMAIIQSEMSKFPSLNVSNFCPQFSHQCSVYSSDPVLLSLQSKYSALEAESIQLQQQQQHRLQLQNEEENVFKNLNDRLKRIELILPKNIVNEFIGFEEFKGKTLSDNLVDSLTDKNFDLRFKIPTISTTTDTDSSTALNTETINRMLSKLSTQNYLISCLIVFNVLFLFLILAYFILKLWKSVVVQQNTNTHSSLKRSNSFPLRRYPLTSLKSSASSTSHSSGRSNNSSHNGSNIDLNLTISHSHSHSHSPILIENIYSPENAPGVVLSDDEILFADARLLNTSTTTRRKRFED